MLRKAIAVLLPALAYANIRIYIKASTPATGAHVEYIGAAVDVVREADIKSFGLEGDRFKDAVKLLSGASPSHTFVNTPTEVAEDISKDLFNSNNLNKVIRKIVPVTGEIIDFKIEPVAIASEVMINDKRETLNVNIEYAENVTDSVEVKWEKRLPVSKDDDITYDVVFGLDITEDMRDEINRFIIDSHFGKKIREGKEKEVIETFNLNLEPGEEIESTLKMDKATMNVQVNFTVTLTGDVVCFYPESYKGKQVWGYDINDVLKAGNMPYFHEVYEIITLEYYVNPRIEIVGI